MVALERINVHETVGRKSNCKLNFFSMYFVRKNEEIADTSFKYTTISLIYKFKCIAAFSVYFIQIVFLF